MNMKRQWNHGTFALVLIGCGAAVIGSMERRDLDRPSALP